LFNVAHLFKVTHDAIAVIVCRAAWQLFPGNRRSPNNTNMAIGIIDAEPTYDVPNYAFVLSRNANKVFVP